MANSMEKKKRARRSFVPLHFSLQKISNMPNKYVLLGLDEENKISAKVLSHRGAVAHAKQNHPDIRVPVDNNPDHDIIYVWNYALNEYVPQSATAG